MSDTSTLKVMDKIMGEDRKALAAREKKMSKGDGSYFGPMGDMNEEIRIKKADAGGFILCWYGPNGSRDVIAKTKEEIGELVSKFFSGEEKDADEE